MADISTYLKQILSAVYGKDVRQAIHDAIHQCYTDGSAVSDAVADIITDKVESTVTEQIKEMLEDGTLAALEVETDTTLSVSGAAADSAAVGEALENVFSLEDLLDVIFDYKISNLTMTGYYYLNRALIASDGMLYYKAITEKNYNSYNLFIFNVSSVDNIYMTINSPNSIIRIGTSSETVQELVNEISSLSAYETKNVETLIVNTTADSYTIDGLNVSSANSLMIYVGMDVTELDYNNSYSKNFVLKDDIVTPESTTFISGIVVDDTQYEDCDYTVNDIGDILAYENDSLFAYLNSSSTFFAISFPVDTHHGYRITASDISRCRIALFDTTNIIYGDYSIGTRAYSIIAYNDTLAELDVEFVPEVSGMVVAYLSNTSTDVDVTVQVADVDGYTLDPIVQINNDNIQDSTITKSKLAFDFSSSDGGSRIPLLSDILTDNTADIDTIYEFESAPDTYETDSTGKVLDVSTEDFYGLFYDTWVGTHPDGFKVTKTQLGMDESGTYPLYEYDFCPKSYTYTVLLTSGMHTYELSAHFGLAWFMKTYMRQVDGESLSDGFEYLRKHVRIKVIPIINPWGWNQSPKTYGNVNGVNINRNFDYETDDGESAWEQFEEADDEWNQKGSAAFSEAEAQIVRDWALSNQGAYFWIDCHTGLGLGPWDNFIYYSSDDEYVDRIVAGLATLEERIQTKYSKTSPTKEVRIDHEGSIRLRWGERVAGIPGMTIEQTPNNTLWGTSLNNESGDITEFAVTIYCYLFSVLPYNIDAKTWIESLLSNE